MHKYERYIVYTLLILALFYLIGGNNLINTAAQEDINKNNQRYTAKIPSSNNGTGLYVIDQKNGSVYYVDRNNGATKYKLDKIKQD